MIISIDNKTYGRVDIKIDYNSYIGKGLDKLKINVEYNKSKKDFYAYIMLNKKKIRLHRYIMSCPDGLVVDHINGDTKDNRISNLRVITQKENLKNRMDSIKKPSKSNNKLGIRGLFMIYDKRDKRYFYRFKLKGYKTKNFSIKKFKEAKEYALNPDLSKEHFK